ncbi:cell division control protein 4 [Trichophyton violaceum]|uniref:Probable E3 ubiquitin ligase complex SCF subunit sconB n=1 Tax=Trichophyton violaceum TaxID=34388 RepID=A0A178FSE3_TRIVO|nr:cell division control protein 4 [Trichophyton violaceum]
MSPLSGKSTRKPANSSTNGAESALPESTVTSSFNAVSEGDTAQKSDDCIPSSGTVGQFSFAPATQTTVVTTTTTTTTKFPPFVMRPPRFSGQLDPKVYPLASMPTPAPLRDIRFVLNGKSVIFHEADDVPGILSKFNEQQESLKTSGAIRSMLRDAPESSKSDASNSNLLIRSRPPRSSDTRRPPSPTSNATAEPTPATIHNSSEEKLQQTGSEQSVLSRRYDLPQRELGLATPETENTSFLHCNKGKRGQRTRSMLGKQYHEEPSSVSGIASPIAPSDKDSNGDSCGDGLEKSPLLEKQSSTAPTQAAGRRGNTQLDNGSIEGNLRKSMKMKLQVKSRRNKQGLLGLEPSNSQNMCLPSPSLSPIALMNAQQLGEASDSTDDGGADSSLDELPKSSNKGIRTKKVKKIMDYSKKIASRGCMPLSPNSSVLDMPNMLSSFEAIPDELKSYMMYQFLRRCPKSTLHLVANVVNPALKCDFLSNLPLELGLNIVKYLDVKSMCRASQVCRKWRHIINSDEKTWKAHFVADGFVLPAGELQQAIEQGWGWQFSMSPSDGEKDLRTQSFRSSDSECSSSSAWHPDVTDSKITTLPTPFSPSPRKLKRKATAHLSGRRAAKRAETVLPSPSEDKATPWLQEQLTASENPFIAANAAAMAVPYPDFGLPSLKSLHLYKTLYQRHYSIKHNWMREDAKPLHLAFRAHDRHVVTCLQFDTDKILTGSDDTNINVYNTKTGALQSTLQGHEGGVWALEYYGNTLVSGSTDRSVRVWDIESAKCTQIFHGHTSTVRCLQILLPAEVGTLPDGTPEMMPREPLIITGSRDSTLRVWTLPKPSDPTYFQAGPAQDDGTCPYFVRVMVGHTHSVRAIAAHGDTLVSGSYDCTVRVWKISTGEAIHCLQGHSFKVYSVVLDHKRNRCISGSMDHMVKIWSLDTGAVLYNLEGHTSLVGLLDLNAGRLVSAAADYTLRIWDPENGQCKNTLTAHTNAITCFQHDSQKVISGSDRTLKMWNVKTGECLKDLLTDLSGVWQVRFNDRRCVAAVQRNRLTYIEVLDFGAYRDGTPAHKLGQRIVVDENGEEISDEAKPPVEEEVSDS